MMKVSNEPKKNTHFPAFTMRTVGTWALAHGQLAAGNVGWLRMVRGRTGDQDSMTKERDWHYQRANG